MANTPKQTKPTRPRRFAREVSGSATTKVEAPETAVIEAAPKAPRESKIGKVLDLLRREQGATLAELVDATGWLPHTTRAALTGLKKKGHTFDKTKRDDVTCYRVVVVG